MRTSLFWHVTHSKLVVSLRRFEFILENERIVRPETYVTTNLGCVTSQKREDLVHNVFSAIFYITMIMMIIYYTNKYNIPDIFTVPKSQSHYKYALHKYFFYPVKFTNCKYF